MNRRGMLWAAISALGAGFAAHASAATTDAKPARKLKVVYHLGNIQNHFDGVGGPANVTLALVVHGPALRAFHLASANPDLTARLGHLSKAGLDMAACGNTMKAQNVTLAQLQPGFVTADSGGVVRIAELQAQGYLYLRP